MAYIYIYIYIYIHSKEQKGRSGWVLLGTADRLAPKWPRIDGIRAVLTIAKLIPQFQTYLADN